MLPTIDFNSLEEVVQYLDQCIITNHNNEITAEQHNNIENGLAKFIKQAPRNWDKASVIVSAGNYIAVSSQCILVFRATGSITLTDNRWNEWTILNYTSSNKQLVGTIASYRTVLGTIKNYISATSAVTIAKAIDGLWYEIGGSNSAATAPKKPLIGVAGEGGEDDPIVGESTYQNDKLIGLGSQNNDRILAIINNIPQSNFGNPNFSLDNVSGTINISPNVWLPNDSLYIDLNQ